MISIPKPTRPKRPAKPRVGAKLTSGGAKPSKGGAATPAAAPAAKRGGATASVGAGNAIHASASTAKRGAGGGAATTPAKRARGGVTATSSGGGVTTPAAPAKGTPRAQKPSAASPRASRSRRPGSRGNTPLRILLKIAAPLLLIAALSVTGYFYATRYAKEAELARYPIDFKPVIEQYSVEFGLDPAFVSAIILCESSYNPDARSGVDARGLMQIMPDTGEWIAGKLGEADAFVPDMLYDPELNIRYSCWYFNYLSERFEGEPQVMAAAYHSGPNLVARWLEDERYSSDGRTLTELPETSPQAQKYVKRVLEAYEKYKALYTFNI